MMDDHAVVEIDVALGLAQSAAGASVVRQT
jgi:hypothetical protein